jgi:Dockerin type I domain
VPVGSTLDINLGSAGPVAISASGGNITASQNGVQITLAGFTGVTVTDLGAGDVLNFNGPLALPFSFVNTSSSTLNVNSGTLTFAAVSGGTVNLGTLSIASGASAAITPATTGATTLSLGNLSIASTGTLDVANNEVLINYGSGTDPISSVAAWIASGYNTGLWNGTGIISSNAQTRPHYALGYADSADTGNPANLATQQIKIVYTLSGDANLDGSVNGTDLGIVATNFNKSVKGPSGWDQGDFNYDGSINGTDLGDVSTNFNQGANIDAGVVAAPVTETVVVVASNTTAGASLTSPVANTDATTVTLHKAHKIRRH